MKYSNPLAPGQKENAKHGHYSYMQLHLTTEVRNSIQKLMCFIRVFWVEMQPTSVLPAILHR